MAAVTDIDLCNRALLSLGAKTIGAFTDKGDRAKICAAVYPGLKDDILSRHDWRFTIVKRQLARLADAPISQWTYVYALPSNRLTDAPLAVFNSSVAGSAPVKDFEIKKLGFYTNELAVYIDYQQDGTVEDSWPPYFQNLIVVAMKGHIGFGVTGSKTLEKMYYEQAFGTPGEGGNGGLLATTRARNARENPTIPFTDFTLINVRNEGAY